MQEMAERQADPADASAGPVWGRWRVRGMAAVLLALAAVIAVSLFSLRLFDTEPALWTPRGVKRLLLLAAGFALWTAAWRRFDARIFATATAALFAAYSAVAVGPLAVLAPAGVLFVCYVVGRRIVDDDLLAVLTGAALAIFVLSFAVHLRVNYWFTYLGAAVLLLAVMRRTAAACAQRLRGILALAAGARRWQRAAVEALAFILFAHLLVALKPEVSADGLAVHLAVPFTVQRYGLWDFNAQHTTWAVMPLGVDWLYTAAYLFGGEGAARLLNYSFLLLLAAAVYALARRFAGGGVAVFATALFLSSPVVQLVTGSLFVENAWTALVLGGVLALIQDRQKRDVRLLLVAGVLLGTAVACKFGALLYVLPALVFAARGRRALVLAAVTLAFAAPPYVTAFVKTGNPVFPFFNHIFRSPYYPPEIFIDDRFRTPIGPHFLWQLTFETSRYLEARAGGFGFQYLLAVPLVLLAVSKRWRFAAWLCLAVAAVGFALTFSAQSYIRYIYPAMALMMALTALCLEGMLRSSRALASAGMAALAGAFALNIWFLPASGWYHSDLLLNPFSERAATQYLRDNAPSRVLIGELNRRAAGDPVVFIENGQWAGLLGRAYITGWHNTNFALELLNTLGSVDCLRIVQKRGARWFIVPADLTVLYPHLQRLLGRYTDQVVVAGELQLRRLRPGYETPEGLERAALLDREDTLKAGTYDDHDARLRFHGRWVMARIFPEAHNRSITVSNTAGNKVEFAFEGSEFTYVYTAAWDRGRAAIWIDGREAGRVDLYSPKIAWQRKATFRAPAGVHVVSIRITGEKQPEAKDHFVDIDAVVIR